MLIDVHHHYLPEKIFKQFSVRTNDKRLEGNTISITLNKKLYIIEEHIKDMTLAGVAKAVLSYAALTILGQETCKTLNSEIYRIVKCHEDMFFGCTHLPANSVEGLQELHHCYQEYGFHFACLPTSYPEKKLNDLSLSPYYEYCEKNEIPIIVHPVLKPTITSNNSPTLGRSIGRAFEVTEAIFLLIMDVLPKFPNIKFIMPHMGGAYPFLLGRFSMFYEPKEVKIPVSLQNMAKTQTEITNLGINEWIAQATGQIWLDLAGSGAWLPAMVFSMNIFGTGQLLFGSDYPLESKNAKNYKEYIAAVNNMPITAVEKENIYSQNLLKLISVGR